MNTRQRAKEILIAAMEEHGASGVPEHIVCGCGGEMHITWETPRGYRTIVTIWADGLEEQELDPYSLGVEAPADKSAIYKTATLDEVYAAIREYVKRETEEEQ